MRVNECDQIQGKTEEEETESLVRYIHFTINDMHITYETIKRSQVFVQFIHI